MMTTTACASTTPGAPEAPTPPAPVTAADTAARPPAPRPALPPIPAVDGALQLNVSYPPEGTSIAVRDSNFIFGSTGSGRSALTINGQPVEVKPNGAWLAFLPVPRDGVYRLQAVRDSQTVTMERRVRVTSPPPAPPARARIVPGSITPAGAVAALENELIELSFTGTAGGRAWVVLPGGRRLPLVESRALDPAANNAADFQTSPAGTSSSATGVSRYSGVFPATALRARDSTALPLLGAAPVVARPDSLMERCAAAAAAGALERTPACRSIAVDSLRSYSASRATDATVELVVGADTLRAPVPLNLGTLAIPRTGVVVSPDTTAKGRRDYRIRGRNSTSGPFHFFWPHGTMLSITGQRGGLLRVRLGPERSAWVPASEVRLLPAGTPPPGGGISSARFAAQPEYIDLRIPLPDRLPYHIEEGESTLELDVFGAVSLINFFQYGSLDPLIARAKWSQPADSVFRVTVELTRPVWGYSAFHDASGALILRIRRPPVIADRDRPLQGLIIAVDAGHGGADSTTMGPTRLTEARANLMIARQLKPLLEQAGARVMMTRDSDVFVDLNARPQMATDSNAHILVSVHNNAFPDGVNPFLNNGTSTYYYHPHSVDLAQHLQRELLDELQLRDIGYGRADLALVRPTWMPAVLTETSFMMVPEQEAALRNPEVQERIARAHLRGLEAFVRGRVTR